MKIIPKRDYKWSIKFKAVNFIKGDVYDVEDTLAREMIAASYADERVLEDVILEHKHSVVETLEQPEDQEEVEEAPEKPKKNKENIVDENKMIKKKNLYNKSMFKLKK